MTSTIPTPGSVTDAYRADASHEPGATRLTGPELPVDRRIARTRAEAEADRARAETEAVRARTRAESEDRAAARAHSAAEQTRRDREQALRERAERRRERAERRAHNARRRAARRAAWMEGVRRAAVTGARAMPEVAGVVACTAPTAIATTGQFRFAADVMHLGPLAVLFPAMLEGAGWMLAWRRHQALRAEHPLGRLTAGVWTLALTAAGLNYWHGAAGGNVQVGFAYAIASLVGFALVELLARHHRGASVTGRQQRARRLLGVARALRYPLLSWAAWSHRIALGVDIDPEHAWQHAWTAREARRAERAARRAASQSARRHDGHATSTAPGDGQDGTDPAGRADTTTDQTTRQTADPSADGETGQDDGPEIDVSDLLEPGREAVDAITQRGERLVRASLVAELRKNRIAVSTDRATALLSRLRAENTRHEDTGREDDAESEQAA